MDINKDLPYHVHNGTDAPKISGGDLNNAPQSAMTTASATAFSTGGVAVLSASDATILNNMRTRINELETKLRDLQVIL